MYACKRYDVRNHAGCSNKAGIFEPFHSIAGKTHKEPTKAGLNVCFLARFEREAFERAIGRERIEAGTVGNVIWHSADVICHRV